MTEDQQDFVSGKSVMDTYIEAAKELLLEHGYRVTDPIVINAEVNNHKKLRDYFYMRLDSKYPNRHSNRMFNRTLDIQILSRLVKARMETGLGEKAAIQECVAIIDTIFNYEEEFKFKRPILDTTILGQAKAGWITAKALKMMDDKRRETEHDILMARAKEVEDSVDSTPEEVESRLDALLKSMEDNN